jgi:hypothetical protein
VETFQITDAEGAPLPETITGVAGSAMDVAIEYKPGDVTSYEDRKVQPPEKWLIYWFIYDSSGNDVSLKMLRLPEISSYETLGMEGRRVGAMKQVLDWVSPEKPPRETPGMTARWGHLRFPTDPGDYELEIRTFPTSTLANGRGFPGPPLIVRRIPLKVQAAEPGSEPVQPTIGESVVCSKKERKFRQQMFGRPSKEFLAKNKE